MADDENPNRSYNFVPGTLNPTPFKLKHKVYSSSMILDDPLSSHTKMMASTMAPDMYDAALTWDAVVLASSYNNSEETPIWARLSKFLPASLLDENTTTAYYCMIPELHTCMVNPLILTGPDADRHAGDIIPQYPKFYIAANSGIINTSITKGDIVTVQFRDGAQTHGEIIRVVSKNDDPPSPVLLKSTRQVFEASQGSLSDLSETFVGAPTDSVSIPCSGPSVTIKSGVKLIEPATSFLKMVGPWLPSGTVITSGTRGSENQTAIIQNYAKSKLGLENLETQEQVEDARQKLITKPKPGLLIGPVKQGAPSDSYGGHFGGLALDFSGVALETLEQHIRQAESYMPSITITKLLFEASNNCIHVEFPRDTYYNADELFTKWQEYTGCYEDPTSFAVANTVANFSFEGSETLASVDEYLAAVSPENSDQHQSDFTTANSSPT